ncbi:hypothetical protein LCGC14_1750920, partial [marine sediment metagenome]
PKDIRGPEYMKLYDRLTAHGGAGLGYKQLKIHQTAFQPQQFDLDKIGMFKKHAI